MCLAVPGQILEIRGEDSLSRTGLVSFGGAVKEILLACTPEAEPQDYVLVHAGLAIAVIDQAAASRLREALEQLGESSDEPELPVTPIQLLTPSDAPPLHHPRRSL